MRDQRRNRKAPLEHFLEGWLLWGNLAPKTRSWYREVFTGFIGWMRENDFDGVLGELDPQAARKWQFHLESAGRSTNTIRGYLATLKSFSRYLAEERIALGPDQRPLDLLKEVKVPKLPRTRPQVYRDDELDRILSGINRHHMYGARNSALILVMLDGGLRLNEVCQLRIDDVDWATGRILVRWESAKRRKERVTHVGRKTLLELRRYLEEYRPPDVLRDELFVDEDGGQLTPNAVQCVLARLRKKLGLKRLTAHQFRRTSATNFRRMGVGDLYDLQREGGWEDLEVPQRFYVDLEDSGRERASVMDLWETERRKRERVLNRPVQVVAPIQKVGPVQGVQVVEPPKMRRSGKIGATSNARSKRV
jgi:integrase/recombinase XerD